MLPFSGSSNPDPVRGVAGFLHRGIQGTVGPSFGWGVLVQHSPANRPAPVQPGDPNATSAPVRLDELHFRIKKTLRVNTLDPAQLSECL